MKIEATALKAERDVAKIAAELTKAVAVAIPLIIAAQPGAAMAAISASAPSIIEIISSLHRAKGGTLGNSAWTIVSSAYALALGKVLASAPISRRPKGPELETLIHSMLARAKILVDDYPQDVSLDALYAPLKIPFVRDGVKTLPHELSIFSLNCPVGDCRILFERSMVEALTEVRNAKPDMFNDVERALSGAFANAVERRKSLGRHHDFIIKSFTQRPIFGQEETGITLEDLYVRQRAIWNTKETRKQDGTQEGPVVDPSGSFFQDELKKSSKWCFPLHIGDLHHTLLDWLNQRDNGDAIRVVAGGPGSGKSTFARAFAIEVIDNGTHDVLFVPLQEIEATGNFQTRIENLFRNRTDLGLDRAENPLNWLGQRDPDGLAPDRPLLIICDGLDEIAPPGSSEAATVTTDFIQTLGTWMNGRNSGGHFVSAVVLGRTISAQEAFRKLSVNHQALIRVGGLLPLNSSPEWIHAKGDNCLVDTGDMSLIDQRKIFWENWCRAAELHTENVPEALQGDTEAAKALEELTAEPLLLYLLLWTGYLGENWEKAATNRNHVYEAIFQQIYARRWGQERAVKTLSNRQQGGHTATNDLEVSDFFLLQEALGLASWATGGRTVTSEAFQPMLKLYLDRDKYDDLSEGVSSSLKSVALQSYTRSVAADNAGFEFVHKTIGEYLIARGLASWLERSVIPLEKRISDARCAEAADLISKIFWRGSLSSEIARFFEDEIRIRFSREKDAKAFVESRLTPVGSWILKNGVPVHNALNVAHEEISFAAIEQAEQRSLDVFWTGLQAVAKRAFRTSNIHKDGSLGGWEPGPVKLEWPTPYGFQSLFSKLAAPNLISENKRLARFDFLDLRDQAVTDSAFGAVIFSYNEVERYVLPDKWLPISLFGANLAGTHFYSATLGQANLRFANLEGATLIGANLSGANLSNANLREANLSQAILSGASLEKADLQDSELGGAKFFNCGMSGARLKGADFASHSGDNFETGIPTIFYRANLSNAEFTGADLSRVVFSSCSVEGAGFSGCNFTETIVIDTNFDQAVVDAPVEATIEIAIKSDNSAERDAEFAPILLRPSKLGVRVYPLNDDA